MSDVPIQVRGTAADDRTHAPGAGTGRAPRRVLVHLNSLELGGTQLNAIDFAAAVASRGYESVLLGPRPAPGAPDVVPIARERGLTIEVYDEPPTVLGHARLLRRRADELGADLVHGYGTWGAARSIYWGPSRWARRPWVLTMYEMALHPSVHRHVPLVVGTEYLLEENIDRPGRTVLIRPPVDLERDRPPADPAGDGGRVALVLVSRLEEDIKAVAIESAIAAVARMGDCDVTLEIVGTGAAETRLRGIGDDVNARLGRPVVQFLGPMADPRPAYARADVVLGMGGSAARGLAHGKPLVAQGENGWSAVLEPENAASIARNSYWSPERTADPEALLERHLRRLVGDPALRRRLGEFSREFAEQTFGLDAMADRLVDLYDSARERYRARDWLADLTVEARRVPGKAARVIRRA